MSTKPRKLKGLYLRGRTYWLARQHRGQRMFISLRTSDYVTAVAEAMRILHTPELNPTAGLLGDINAFFDFKRTHGLYARSTELGHRMVLLRFAKFVHHAPTESVTQPHIRAFYDALKKSVQPNCANVYMQCVSAFFRWATKTGRIPLSPYRDIYVTPLAKPTTVRFCSPEQRDQIIATAPTPELRFVYYCGFYAGMRRLEICEARPNWFDLTVGTVTVQPSPTFTPKTRKSRTIPLAKPFREFMADYGLPAPYVLCPQILPGKRAYRVSFETEFHAHMTALGLPWVHAHTMRYTFASILASRGCSIYKIAQWLGDTLTTTQNHYARLLPTDSDIDLLK